MTIDLYDETEYDDVLVSFGVSTEFIKRDFNNNLFISKKEFISFNLSDKNNLINYIKEKVNKTIKKNKYSLSKIVIQSEDERCPF